jgi:hypothetical protein
VGISGFFLYFTAGCRGISGVLAEVECISRLALILRLNKDAVVDRNGRDAPARSSRPVRRS